MHVYKDFYLASCLLLLKNQSSLKPVRPLPFRPYPFLRPCKSIYSSWKPDSVPFFSSCSVVDCTCNTRYGFLQKHGLTLDFTTTPVTIHVRGNYQPELQPIVKELRKFKTKVCAVSTVTESLEDTIDDYAVPTYHIAPNYDLPRCHNALFPLFWRLIKIYFRPYLAR